MECSKCQVDEQMVEEQVAAFWSMTPERREATIKDIDSKSDDRLHSIYGHQTASIRAIVERVRG